MKRSIHSQRNKGKSFAFARAVQRGKDLLADSRAKAIAASRPCQCFALPNLSNELRQGNLVQFTVGDGYDSVFRSISNFTQAIKGGDYVVRPVQDSSLVEAYHAPFNERNSLGLFYDNVNRTMTVDLENPLGRVYYVLTQQVSQQPVLRN